MEFIAVVIVVGGIVAIYYKAWCIQKAHNLYIEQQLKEEEEAHLPIEEESISVEEEEYFPSPLKEENVLEEEKEEESIPPYDEIVEIYNKSMEIWNSMVDNKGEATIVRDGNKSGHPGFVAPANSPDPDKLTRVQWDLCYKQPDGVFWRAGTIVKDGDGNTVFAQDGREKLLNWLKPRN
jgi:hypothetical protein